MARPARSGPDGILVFVLVMVGLLVIDTIAERMGGDDGVLELALVAVAATVVGVGIVVWRALRRRGDPERGIMGS